MFKKLKEIHHLKMLKKKSGFNSLIAFGDALLNSSLRGNFVAPVQSFYKHFMDYAKSHRGEIYMLDIDEYLTSQICNTCQSCTLQNVESTDEKQKLHSILSCTNCFTIFNKDENTSMSNIEKHIVKYNLKNGSSILII